MDKFAELAARFAPEVIEAARGAVRAEVWSNVAGAVLVVGLIILVLYGTLALRRCLLNQEDDWESEWWMLVVAGYVTAGLLALIPIWCLIDPWTWIAYQNPDLYLAKKVLKL